MYYIAYDKIKLAYRIHIMSGKVIKKSKSNYETYEANLRYAESKFQSEGIIGLIEPINKYSVPDYFMSSYDKGPFKLKNSSLYQIIKYYFSLRCDPTYR